MIKYISIFRLVLRCLLVARKESLTGFSNGLTGRSKNLDPTGNPTGRSTRPVSISVQDFIVSVKILPKTWGCSSSMGSILTPIITLLFCFPSVTVNWNRSLWISEPLWTYVILSKKSLIFESFPVKLAASLKQHSSKQRKVIGKFWQQNKNSLSYSMYYGEACNELTRPISATLRLDNTDPFEKTSQREKPLPLLCPSYHSTNRPINDRAVAENLCMSSE